MPSDIFTLLAPVRTGDNSSQQVGESIHRQIIWGKITVASGGIWAKVDADQSLWGPIVNGDSSLLGTEQCLAQDQDGRVWIVSGGGGGGAGVPGGQAYSQLIGNGAAKSFTIQHNFNTKDVTVSVYRTATPFDEVEAEVERTDRNYVTVRTLTVPTSNQLTVLVAAAGAAGDSGGGGAGGTASGTWRWTTSTTDANSGQIGGNTAAWATMTNLIVNRNTASGADARNVLTLVTAGNGVYLQDSHDANNWAHFTVSGTPLTTGEVWGIPVTYLSSGGTPPGNNRDTLVTFGGGGGGGGGGDKNYVFTQGVPSAAWSVAHNLSKYPAVSVVDTGGTEVIPDVHYIDVNNVNLNFGSATSGKAYFN